MFTNAFKQDHIPDNGQRLPFLSTLPPLGHLGMILSSCLVLMMLVAPSSVTAQVTLYSDISYKGDTKEYDTKYKVRDIEKEVGFPVKSVKITAGYKLTLYFDEAWDDQGNHFILYEGEYNDLPDAYFREYKFQSLEVEKVSEDLNLVKVRYDFEKDGEEPLIKAIEQYLSVGSYKSKKGLGQFAYGENSSDPKEGVNAVAKYFTINNITIPRGLVVTLTNDDDYTEDFPTNPSTEDSQTITPSELDKFKDGISKLEITAFYYRLQRAELTPVGKPETIEESENGVESELVNNSYDRDSEQEVALEYSAEVSTENTVEKSATESNTFGIAASVGVEVEASGKPLGVGASTTFNASLETSYQHSWEQSTTTGESESSSEGYSLTASCTATCPPRSKCKIKATGKRIKQDYEAINTLVRWDPETDSVDVDDTQTIKSKVTLEHVASAVCYVDSTEALAPVASQMPDDMKYETILSLHNIKGKYHLTSLSDDVQSLADHEFIPAEECRIYTETYYSALSDDEKDKLTPLVLYSRYYESDDRIDYLTISESAGFDTGDYKRIKALGYVFKEEQSNTIPITLYKSSDNKDHYSTIHPENAKGYDDAGVQGYVRKF